MPDQLLLEDLGTAALPLGDHLDAVTERSSGQTVPPWRGEATSEPGTLIVSVSEQQ